MTRSLPLAALLAIWAVTATTPLPPRAARAAEAPAGLVGKWAVANTGDGFKSAAIYTFKAGGAYEMTASMESTLAALKVSMHETGTFSVDGGRLTMNRKGGTSVQKGRDSTREKKLAPETRPYQWRIVRDPIDNRRVLLLTNARG